MAQPSGDPATTAPASVAAMPLRLPDFWPGDPAIWFVQVEAQFASHRITSQESRYNAVVSVLPPTIAMEVRDLLLHRPEDLPYTKLKEEIIRRTTASERRRLQQLLTSEDLGDQKPSQLLRRMQHLLGDRLSTVDEAFLRELFLQRLPNSVRMILASAGDVQLSRIAEMADNIMEVCAPSLSALSQPHNSDIADLRAEVSRLTGLVETLTTNRRPPRRRSQSRQTLNRRRSSPAGGTGLCYYHQKFAHRARRCVSPCSFASSDQGNGQALH